MTATLDVESVEGFVEKKDMGLLGKGASDIGALLLSAGELIDLAIGNVTEIHGGNGFFGFLAIDFPEAFEVSKMGVASHRDDVADSNGKVPLVLIDLGKVCDLASGFCDGGFTPVDDAALLFQKSGEGSLVLGAEFT